MTHTISYDLFTPESFYSSNFERGSARPPTRGLMHCPVVLTLLVLTQLAAADEFADDLVQCIQNTAEKAANTFPDWGSGCLAPTTKVDIQAAVLKETLAPIRAKWGYSGALWCSFYATRMTGAEYHPGDPQPNNPHFSEWYETILCPWDLWNCGGEPLGMHGDESQGVPVEWTTRQNEAYRGEPRRTMSCGLCGHLDRTLGRPPCAPDSEPIPMTPRTQLIVAPRRSGIDTARPHGPSPMPWKAVKYHIRTPTTYCP